MILRLDGSHSNRHYVITIRIWLQRQCRFLPPIVLFPEAENIEKPLARHTLGPDQNNFIQNLLKNEPTSTQFAESDAGTQLTCKSAKNYADWCISQLLEPSGRRVMAKSMYLHCFRTSQILDASVANGFWGVMISWQSRRSGGAAKYNFTDFGQTILDVPPNWRGTAPAY